MQSTPCKVSEKRQMPEVKIILVFNLGKRNFNLAAGNSIKLSSSEEFPLRNNLAEHYRGRILEGFISRKNKKRNSLFSSSRKCANESLTAICALPLAIFIHVNSPTP